MTTYATLRDSALKQCGAYGESEMSELAEIALAECMKFVSFHIRVPALVGSATATAPASPELESNALSIASDFSIADFRTPDRLFVKKNSSAVELGTPYEFLEYDTTLDLLYSPSSRYGIVRDLDEYGDDIPDRWYTITPSNKIWARPLSQGNVLTFFYRKEPAAFSGAGTPEINPQFDWILTKGAVLAIKEAQREPDRIMSMWDLFTNGLEADLDRYDSFLNGRRKRDEIRIHKSHRP